MKDDVADLKFTLLNPDDGVIVNTNKNTENRVFHENKAEIYNQNVIKLNELENWKIGVNRALWIIFGVLATVIIRMLIVHSEKLTQ